MQGFGDGINGGLGHLQDAIPEKLLGKQLGEMNARRQKELLKMPGTVRGPARWRILIAPGQV